MRKKNFILVEMIFLAFLGPFMMQVKAYAYDEVITTNKNPEEKLMSRKVYGDVSESSIHKKVVYLTFDDGPSKNNTPEILDILNKNNVKASFFLIGKKAELNKDIVKNLYSSGMCIFPHSYSHEYEKIYKSKEAYIEDFSACNAVISNITGEKSYDFVRLPGGSYNKVSKDMVMNDIRQYLKSNNVKYIDWNVSSADATPYKVSSDTIRDNVISQCKYWDVSVVLMHDSEGKKSTVEALPEIIKYLKEDGYTFKTFKDTDSEEINRMIKYKILNR